MSKDTEPKRPLWIKHYLIRDIRAVELEEMDTGKVQVITGGEGTGKSTRLEALQAAFTPQEHRPALVREGAEEGTVIVELSDGTTIERTYQAGEGAPRAKVQRGKFRPTAVQQFLDEFFGEGTFDLMAFLDKDIQEQTKELMMHMPVELANEKAIELGDSRKWENVDYTAHPLVLLWQLEQAMCEERLETGREEKMHQETAYGIFHDDLPEGFDFEAAEAASSEQLSNSLAVARLHNTKIEDARQCIELNKEKCQRVQEAREQVGKEIERLQNDLKGLEGNIDELAESDEAMSVWLTETEPISTDDLLKQLADHDKTKEQLGVWRSAQEHQEKADELKTAYLHLSDLIQAVRLTPGVLLSKIDLPIEGLTFNTEEGWFEIDGRPLEALSDGEQLRLALDVARMTSGPLKVITIDQAERLDPERYEQLLKAAQEDDFQYFIARVGEGEIEIACFDEGEWKTKKSA